MRLRATTVLNLSALVALALTGCSTDSADSIDPASSTTVPHKAKASFTNASGSDSLAEELYSDTEERLSEGVSRIFAAMTSCHAYEVLVGATP